MKKHLLKAAFAALLLFSCTGLVKAQTYGDNLGNHKATKDLQMQTKVILNTAGLAIGTAAFTNTSIALQIDAADKAILIPRVATNAAIVAPLDGMIIYNTTDQKFFLFQGGAWVTFALAIKEATDGINATGIERGYTLTQVGQETILKLSPATLTMPGIVTIDAQSFGGDKTFGGNVIVTGNAEVLGTSTFTVGTGLTALGGKLTVADSVDLAQGLGVAERTTLNADTTLGANGGLFLKNIQTGSGILGEKFLVVGTDGTVKRSTFSAAAFGKYPLAIPTGASAGFGIEGNSSIEFVLPVPGLKTDDGVVVNFASTDILSFKGLTILSAYASAIGTVTVTIADLRNPAETVGYAAPELDGKNLIVTRYTPGF